MVTNSFIWASCTDSSSKSYLIELIQVFTLNWFYRETSQNSNILIEFAWKLHFSIFVFETCCKELAKTQGCNNKVFNVTVIIRLSGQCIVQSVHHGWQSTGPLMVLAQNCKSAVSKCWNWCHHFCWYVIALLTASELCLQRNVKTHKILTLEN